MENKMSIEEKLAYIRRALELGADIDLNFHCFKEKKQAKQVAVELSKLGNMKHKQTSHNGTDWYKIKSEDYSLSTSIFFDTDYLEEDVILDGMEELA
jgi:hypothetical protein